MDDDNLYLNGLFDDGFGLEGYPFDFPGSAFDAEATLALGRLQPGLGLNSAPGQYPDNRPNYAPGHGGHPLPDPLLAAQIWPHSVNPHGMHEQQGNPAGPGPTARHQPMDNYPPPEPVLAPVHLAGPYPGDVPPRATGMHAAAESYPVPVYDTAPPLIAPASAALPLEAAVQPAQKRQRSNTQGMPVPPPKKSRKPPLSSRKTAGKENATSAAKEKQKATALAIDHLSETDDDDDDDDVDEADEDHRDPEKKSSRWTVGERSALYTYLLGAEADETLMHWTLL